MTGIGDGCIEIAAIDRLSNIPAGRCPQRSDLAMQSHIIADGVSLSDRQHARKQQAGDAATLNIGLIALRASHSSDESDEIGARTRARLVQLLLLNRHLNRLFAAQLAMPSESCGDYICVFRSGAFNPRGPSTGRSRSFDGHRRDRPKNSPKSCAIAPANAHRQLCARSSKCRC